MRIVSDLHTHTRHSHGTGSIEDNVRAAIDKGLRAIAISDHGFDHIFYSIRDVDRYLQEIGDIKAKYAGKIDVLSNVELNLLSLDGKVDIPEGYEDSFDLKMFGYHKMVRCSDFKSARQFLLPKRHSVKSVALNTAAYIAAIEKNKIDIITHPGYGLPIDKIAVAKAAKEHGTALEINAKHPEFTVDELIACAQTGVTFVIGSDAHSPDRVGDFAAALERAQQAGLQASQIINAEE
ncbi:PHP domain-containing protein [Christensenellaceae bacterium OttesenSCG-928-K19]|nr:PHP domain-containing protein [Christensenellaceae bacterium OttesenSCG-928-K19]